MIAASTLSSWNVTASTIKTQFGFDPTELTSTSGDVDTTNPPSPRSGSSGC